jgi:hypothetical protein
LICPDTKPDGFLGFQLEGSQGEMISKNFGFYIKRCMNKPNCKKKSEIDEYISDLLVQGWNIQDAIDFNIYDNKKPVY